VRTGIAEVWLRLTDAAPDAQVDTVDRITDITAEVDPSRG
jgi:hypothetical protein